MGSCIERGIQKPLLRLACCGLFLGLLTLIVSCSKNPHEVAHAEVSGKVLFKGQPLPGGKVTFVARNGGFASSGTIDEDGHYQIKPPVGDVEIGVTNEMLQTNLGDKALSHPEKTGAEKAQAIKGRWVRIPSDYEDPHTSGLTYTVKPGTQTHDIELADKASSATGAPKPRSDKPIVPSGRTKSGKK